MPAAPRSAWRRTTLVGLLKRSGTCISSTAGFRIGLRPNAELDRTSKPTEREAGGSCPVPLPYSEGRSGASTPSCNGTGHVPLAHFLRWRVRERMRSMKLLTPLVLLMLSAATPSAQIDARMFRYPAVSSNQIAFVYAGDIWLVPKTAGTAARLSSPPGE